MLSNPGTAASRGDVSHTATIFCKPSRVDSCKSLTQVIVNLFKQAGCVGFMNNSIRVDVS